MNNKSIAFILLTSIMLSVVLSFGASVLIVKEVPVETVLADGATSETRHGFPFITDITYHGGFGDSFTLTDKGAVVKNFFIYFVPIFSILFLFRKEIGSHLLRTKVQLSEDEKSNP